MKRQIISSKAMAVIVTFIFISIFIVQIPLASAHSDAEKTTSMNKALSIKLQKTPPIDSNLTTLKQEKLQLDNNWFWNFSPTLISTFAILMAGIFGLYRWFKDKQAERDKQKIAEENLFKDRQIDRERRAEERFQLVVEGLGSEKIEAKVGAAIMLRTFLQSGYEQFYNQAFDLAVANLRMRSVNPNVPNSIDPLSQALIVVFKESFQRTREELRKLDPQFSSEYLDATRIQLDKAYLVHADLKEIWMPEASLQASNLNNAKLTRANLSGAHLSQANLWQYTELCVKSESGILNWTTVQRHQEDTNDSQREPYRRCTQKSRSI